MEAKDGATINASTKDGISSSVEAFIGTDGAWDCKVTVQIEEDVKRTSHTNVSDGSGT